MKRVELAFFALAAVMHAGALGATHLFPGINLLTLRERSPDGEPVEVEILEEEARKEEKPEIVLPEPEQPKPEPTEEEVATHDAQPDARPDSSPAGHQPRSRGAAAPGPAGPDGASEPNPGAVATTPGDSEWGVPEDPGGEIDPTTGLPKPRLSDLTRAIAIANAKAPPAKTKTDKRALVSRDKADEVINEALRSQDKKLGLDLPAAGTVASLFRGAVQGSEAPPNSKVSFVVELGPGGTVRSVRVGSSVGGNAATWNAIAASVKAALASQKLNLSGQYAKGAIISVSVQSKVKMPSGAEVGAGPKLSLTQNFDVADIGASPVKVVSVSHSVTPVK